MDFPWNFPRIFGFFLGPSFLGRALGLRIFLGPPFWAGPWARRFSLGPWILGLEVGILEDLIGLWPISERGVSPCGLFHPWASEEEAWPDSKIVPPSAAEAAASILQQVHKPANGSISLQRVHKSCKAGTSSC